MNRKTKTKVGLKSISPKTSTSAITNPNFLGFLNANNSIAADPILRPSPFPPFPLFRRCTPKVLIVCDNGLSYQPNDGFGLWRFVHAITEAAGVTLKPTVTLAHRSTHVPVTIGATTYTVQQNFNFATATPAINVGNYDQIWLFGFRGSSPTAAEVKVIADFMNKGGGVFATGDHGIFGFALCGSLPRIRFMREWSETHMGGEVDATEAVLRIDTITNPGTNNLYDFADQSDNIPQHIFPNYKVIDTDGLGTGATAWQASIHPLLALPGAALIRNSNFAGGANLQFQNDIDVLPDHAHESVCYDAPRPVVLASNYTLSGLNFPEFQPNASAPATRVANEIVAYAISGGRSVLNGVWKPPVKPRMFGVISAYDGRLAQPYTAGGAAPGRIVCDSTWHHFLNINLDGTQTLRSGLGTWSGGSPGVGTFTPSPDLDKIYTYYRNTVDWLQPANRVWCSIFILTTRLATHPELVEEMFDTPKLSTWKDFVRLGQQASVLLTYISGSQALPEMIKGALTELPETRDIGIEIAAGELHRRGVDVDNLQFGILGGLLVKIVEGFPAMKSNMSEKEAEAVHEKQETMVKSIIPELVSLGLEDHRRRAKMGLVTADRHIKTLNALRK